MSDLLLELFSEEIPARMQARAASDLERLVNQHLLDEGFLPEGVKAFATPRRLALIATGLPIRQDDKKEERKGPRVGAPDKAVEGFLRAAGLDNLDQCETRSDKKGEFHVAIIDRKGQETTSVIADMVPEIIRNFPWQKSMRWGAKSGNDGALKWVRPLHSILCTFDDEIVNLEVDGINSSDRTWGHRFMAPAEIKVRNFNDYAARLKDAKVILDTEERKELIVEEAKTLCQAQGLELVEDAALLEEVAGLAEWPVVMIGSYDEKFLILPDEVLTASMRGHQKYFSVRDPKTGKLANRFIVAANMIASDGGAAMRTGYERVLTARLSDGWFLYKQDLKVSLEDQRASLDDITFFEGLGTVGEKAQRVATLAKEIASSVGADPASAERAAYLAKADLVTGMVSEFPELQGMMGRYYALEQKEPAIIADAIRDHYKPQGQNDDVPTEPVSVAVALADKIDTLTAFWAIDKKPTGSSDPFALRRAALGIIEIILNSTLRLKISDVIRSANKGLTDIPTTNSIMEGTTIEGPRLGDRILIADANNIVTFFHDRLKVYLRDKGHRHDHTDAVLTNPDGKLEDDMVLIVQRLEALESFLKIDDGANLVAAYKRTANILKPEGKKGALPTGEDINANALTDDAEKDLFKILEKAQTNADQALEKEDFQGAMTALASLRAPVDQFFETVTVNDDDPALRTNRLALLIRFRDATAKIADFSKLEG